MSDGFPERLQREPPRAPQPPRPVRRPGKGVIVVGVLAACLLGLVGGYAMKPVLNEEIGSVKPHRMEPLPQEPQGLGIQVLPGPVFQNPPPAENAVPPPTLPDPAPASEAAARNAPPAPVIRAEEPQPPAAQAQEAPAPPRVVARPSFDCRFPHSPAEQMVCADPQLAAADRRMAQAYRQALGAGVPPQILDRQQAAWMAARENAARDGPAAVADVYGERIAELQGMTRY
jgi:uncharacterized protein YecT (DUF1311 family)